MDRHALLSADRSAEMRGNCRVKRGLSEERQCSAKGLLRKAEALYRIATICGGIAQLCDGLVK